MGVTGSRVAVIHAAYQGRGTDEPEAAVTAHVSRTEGEGQKSSRLLLIPHPLSPYQHRRSYRDNLTHKLGSFPVEPAGSWTRQRMINRPGWPRHCQGNLNIRQEEPYGYGFTFAQGSMCDLRRCL